MSEIRRIEGTPAVDLSHLVRRERKAYAGSEEARALIETGLFETGAKFVFRCPLCGRVERNDQRLEPVCTGPAWTDEHPLEPMILVS